jgi:hypothetical protein
LLSLYLHLFCFPEPHFCLFTHWFVSQPLSARITMHPAMKILLLWKLVQRQDYTFVGNNEARCLDEQSFQRSSPYSVRFLATCKQTLQVRRSIRRPRFQIFPYDLLTCLGVSWFFQSLWHLPDYVTAGCDRLLPHPLQFTIH